MLPFMTYEVLRHIEVTIITRGEAPPLFLEPSHLERRVTSTSTFCDRDDLSHCYAIGA